MQMIKYGYFDIAHDIPAGNTLQLLWNCDPDFMGGYLTKDTMEALIDKSITYIQELSLPKWTTKVALSRHQSAAIRTFLDVQDGDSAEGNLYRHSSKDYGIVSWMCEVHAHQCSDLRFLQELREFVCVRKGNDNMQQGRLQVEMGSKAEADQFRILLKGTKHVFLISVKLCWMAARSYVEELSRDIAQTGTWLLELDSIIPNINPPGCDNHKYSVSDFEIYRNVDLKVMILRNYFRPQEQCIYLHRFSLHSIISPMIPLGRWVELISDMERFKAIIFNATVGSDFITAARELKSVLEKHGLPSATVASIYDKNWTAVFDQECGGVVEVYSQDMVRTKGLLSAGSIRTLGLYLEDQIFDEKLFQMVRSNTLLQDLSVSYHGKNVFGFIENIVRMWHTSACSFRLTLHDHVLYTQSRTVAQLVVNGGTRDPARSTTVDITVSDKNAPLCQRQATDTPVNIDFLQWDCDYVFWHLSDYSTSFLNAASQQHPSALTSFIMDVSQLSPVGLSFVPEILRRSSLEHLTVMCTLFHPSLANYFARLLDSVQWCILKSLILSGDKIDEWCQLWPSPISPRLLSFQITGWSSAVQMLSHSSALFIHQLIFSSPLVELHFENVQFQEKCDWVLVINSMDLCPLRTLGLGESSIMQFLDVPDAVDLIVSRSEETQLRSQGQHLVLPLFTLDVTTLPQSSFAHVEGILSHCILEKLVVKCNSIDLSNSDPVAKVLDSVQWSLLEYLRLSGDDINKWVQLLAKVDTPRLNTLQIWGTKTVQQELSHSGVLFVERLIVTSSLVRLHFKDVLLQDKNDWVLLIEKMDYANLKNFFLGDGSHEQFIATPDAVKLKNSKLFPWVPESWDVEQFCTDEE